MDTERALAGHEAASRPSVVPPITLGSESAVRFYDNAPIDPIDVVQTEAADLMKVYVKAAEDRLVEHILDFFLEEHAPDVTSYDAGWLDGCTCGEWEPAAWGPDQDRWAEYRQHLREKFTDYVNQPGVLDV